MVFLYDSCSTESISSLLLKYHSIWQYSILSLALYVSKNGSRILKILHFIHASSPFCSCEVEIRCAGYPIYAEHEQPRCHERANILQLGRLVAKPLDPLKLKVGRILV